MDIIYKGNQLSHSAQTSGRDINVFKSKPRDYNTLPRPCCILIFSYTTSAPHISLLEYWSLLMATTDRILCEETSNSAQQTQDWKTSRSPFLEVTLPSQPLSSLTISGSSMQTSLLTSLFAREVKPTIFTLFVFLFLKTSLWWWTSNHNMKYSSFQNTRLWSF